MDQKDYSRFSTISVILAISFIFLDQIGDCFSLYTEYSETVNILDVYCVVRSEMFEPFIWLFMALFFIFLVLSWRKK